VQASVHGASMMEAAREQHGRRDAPVAAAAADDGR
jgi:hypothetical protein